MEGKGRAELEEKMRRDYLATMKVNWSVWPLISFINFRFIPPAQRYFPPTTALLEDLLLADPLARANRNSWWLCQCRGVSCVSCVCRAVCVVRVLLPVIYFGCC